jgi:hypothetical protein
MTTDRRMPFGFPVFIGTGIISLNRGHNTIFRIRAEIPAGGSEKEFGKWYCVPNLLGKFRFSRECIEKTKFELKSLPIVDRQEEAL